MYAGNTDHSPPRGSEVISGGSPDIDCDFTSPANQSARRPVRMLCNVLEITAIVLLIISLCGCNFWRAAGQGAANGAAIGSAFGPWGTIIGAGVSAVATALLAVEKVKHKRTKQRNCELETAALERRDPAEPTIKQRERSLEPTRIMP